MIPVFNTRKIREQLRRKRDSLQKRVDTDRSRALFLPFVNVQPIHVHPDPMQREREWPGNNPSQCYEIPREKVELLVEYSGSAHLAGVYESLFDAWLASYANKNHLVYDGPPHRRAVLKGFCREGSGAWKNPWDDVVDTLPDGDISEEEWCYILQLGKDMYGVVEGDPWHHSINLWTKEYWLTAYEAAQFDEIMVPCGEWEGWEQQAVLLEHSQKGWRPLQGSTNRTPRPLKRKILKEAEKIFRRKYAKKCGSLSPGRAGMCPYWALAVIEAAGKHGKRLVLQAGSMQWRIVPPHLDDGVSANAFAYMWSPNEPASRRAIQMGALPEVHVWAADPETKEIIDLSTRDFKRIAENQFGLKWGTKPPPPYLWVNQEEYMAMPDPTYSSDRQATMFVLGLLRKKGLL